MPGKTKYSFNDETCRKLPGFKTYLHSRGNSKSTIRQKMNYAGYYLTWLERENLLPEDAGYNDMLEFIDYCRLQGNSKQHINNKLRSVRHFYEFFKTKHPDVTNPALNLKLKGIRHRLPSGIVSFGLLEKLYHSFKTRDTRSKRNKVILGLLIYQGITTEELHRLSPADIKPEIGKIHIPGNRRRNSRVLELHSFQVLEMTEYLKHVRPKILAEIYKKRPARKPENINEEKIKSRLFISINGSENLKNSLQHLFKAVQKTFPEVRSSKQIRASVITNWLKTYNLREVQYMAGHKFVSSTERYQLNNLDSLQSRLEKYHPLNRN